LIESIDEELLLYDLRSSEPIFSTRVAAAIWHASDGVTPVGELALALGSEAGPSTAKALAGRILRELLEPICSRIAVTSAALAVASRDDRTRRDSRGDVAVRRHPVGTRTGDGPVVPADGLSGSAGAPRRPGRLRLFRSARSARFRSIRNHVFRTAGLSRIRRTQGTVSVRKVPRALRRDRRNRRSVRRSTGIPRRTGALVSCRSDLHARTASEVAPQWSQRRREPS